MGMHTKRLGLPHVHHDGLRLPHTVRNDRTCRRKSLRPSGMMRPCADLHAFNSYVLRIIATRTVRRH